jgi:Trk K+ transport system NAD-binding subunit
MTTAAAIAAPKPDLATRLRYARALLKRFRVTLLGATFLFLALPWVYVVLYPSNDGARLSLGEALHHVYFLLFGQPSLKYVNHFVIEVLNIAIPPFGLGMVVDGGVRFAYLFFAKHRADKEWIEVVAESYQNHVVVCGGGRVGYRVTQQLLALGHQVVVIEKRPDAPFAIVLRDLKVPVLTDDVRAPRCLERVNVRHAQAIVCATDDDLANINIALDARQANPNVRLVIRLFDDDLVDRVRENFHAQAHSTSALAAQTFALAALDPRIVHSFQLEGQLIVVSCFRANPVLSELKVSDLRDRFGGLTLSLKRGTAAAVLHPNDATAIVAGDVLTVQCGYDDYRALRDFTQEARPPRSLTGTEA